MKLGIGIAALIVATSSVASAQAYVFGSTIGYEANGVLRYSPDLAETEVYEDALVQRRVTSVDASVLNLAATYGPGSLVTLNLFDDAVYTIKFIHYEYVHAVPSLDSANARQVWLGSVVASDEPADNPLPTGIAAFVIDGSTISGLVFFRDRRFEVLGDPDVPSTVHIVEQLNNPVPGINSRTCGQPPDDGGGEVAGGAGNDNDAPPPPLPKPGVRLLIARAPNLWGRWIWVQDNSKPCPNHICSLKRIWLTDAPQYQAEVDIMNQYTRGMFTARGQDLSNERFVSLAAIVNVNWQGGGNDPRDDFNFMKEPGAAEGRSDWWNANYRVPYKADLVQYVKLRPWDDDLICGAALGWRWASATNRQWACRAIWSLMHEIGHNFTANHDTVATSPPDLVDCGCHVDADCSANACENPGMQSSRYQRCVAFPWWPPGQWKNLCVPKGRGYYTASFKTSANGPNKWLRDVMAYEWDGCSDRMGFANSDDAAKRCLIMPLYSADDISWKVNDAVQGVRWIEVGSPTDDNIGSMIYPWTQIKTWE